MMQWVGGACTSVGVGGAQLWVGVVWSSAGGRQDSVMGGCGVVQCRWVGLSMGGCGVVQCRWVGLSYGLAWCGPVQVGGAQLWVGMVWSSAGGWGSVMGGHGVVQCRWVGISYGWAWCGPVQEGGGIQVYRPRRFIPR